MIFYQQLVSDNFIKIAVLFVMFNIVDFFIFKFSVTFRIDNHKYNLINLGFK